MDTPRRARSSVGDAAPLPPAVSAALLRLVDAARDVLACRMLWCEDPFTAIDVRELAAAVRRFDATQPSRDVAVLWPVFVYAQRVAAAVTGDSPSLVVKRPPRRGVKWWTSSAVDRREADKGVAALGRLGATVADTVVVLDGFERRRGDGSYHRPS
jgi:hypothetical protein